MWSWHEWFNELSHGTLTLELFGGEGGGKDENKKLTINNVKATKKDPQNIKIICIPLFKTKDRNERKKKKRLQNTKLNNFSE